MLRRAVQCFLKQVVKFFNLGMDNHPMKSVPCLNSKRNLLRTPMISMLIKVEYNKAWDMLSLHQSILTLCDSIYHSSGVQKRCCNSSFIECFSLKATIEPRGSSNRKYFRSGLIKFDLKEVSTIV